MRENCGGSVLIYAVRFDTERYLQETDDKVIEQD